MMKCMLKIDPAKSGGWCYVGECVEKHCGWHISEYEFRKKNSKLVKCADGLWRMKTVVKDGRR